MEEERKQPTEETTAVKAGEKMQAEPTQEPTEQGTPAKKKKGLLDNGNPNFVNAKEQMYDKLPFTVRQMDIFIGICLVLIVVFIVLGVLHIDILPHRG